MATLERHSYKKVGDEWQITKTMKLTYEKIPYSLSCLSPCLVKLEECLTPDLLTPKYREENKTNPMYGHCYHTTQAMYYLCLLYTSPSPRDATLSRMPSSA